MADGPTDGGDAVDVENGEEPSPLGAAAPIAVAREQGRLRRFASRARRADDAVAAPDGGAVATAGRRPARRRRMAPGKKAVIAFAAIVVLSFVPGFVSGLKKTPKNMIGISYGGGPFEGAHFQRIVKPGSSLFFNGFFDPLYLYPADQQQYIISKVPTQGTTQGVDSIIAPTSDRVPLEYQVAVYYKLNTDRLRDFHEQLGLAYSGYTKKGWYRLIQNTFRQQIENSFQEQTRRYTVGQLYGDEQLLVTLQRDVQTSFAARLRNALGEPFFCAPSFHPKGRCDPPTVIVKKIDIPTNVAAAFVNLQVSKVLIEQRVNEVKQRQEEALGINALSTALQRAGNDYVLLKAIESGQINFWVLPQGANGLNLTLPQNPNGTSSGSGTSTPPSTSGTTTTTTKKGP